MQTKRISPLLIATIILAALLGACSAEGDVDVDVAVKAALTQTAAALTASAPQATATQEPPADAAENSEQPAEPERDEKS